MGRRGVGTIAFLAAASVVSAASAGAAGRAVEQSPNVTRVARVAFRDAVNPFEGGTDIAFDGKYAYVGQRGRSGGLHVLDVSKASPRRVGFLPCTGADNDIAFIRRGLLAIGYHDGKCGVPTGGMSLVDVSRPRAPRVVGNVPLPSGAIGVHTVTPYPGKPLVYLSPGGWDQEASPKSLELIVDVSNPTRPKIAATYDPVGVGCHDLSFLIRETSQLAFCAGDSATQIWDVSDPLAPVAVSTIANPFILPLAGMHHTAEASDDGRYLVVGEETTNAECAGGTTGSLWIYDISKPEAPLLVGHYDLPRGPLSSDDKPFGCSAHNFSFLPGTHTLVATWFWGGVNVLDLSTPAAPKEIAYYMDPDAAYWSAGVHEGRIYATGVPGLEVLEVAELP